MSIYVYEITYPDGSKAISSEKPEDGTWAGLNVRSLKNQKLKEKTNYGKHRNK